MVRVNSTLPLTRIMQNVMLVCVLSAYEAMNARFVMRTGRGATWREMSNSLGAPKESVVDARRVRGDDIVMPRGVSSPRMV